MANDIRSRARKTFTTGQVLRVACLYGAIHGPQGGGIRSDSKIVATDSNQIVAAVPVLSIETQGTPAAMFCDTLSDRYNQQELAPYAHAREILSEIVRMGRSAELARWTEPAVNLGRDGTIDIEWWRGKKNLALTLGAEMTYVRAWGSDVENEMADGAFKIAGLAKHWQWLLS